MKGALLSILRAASAVELTLSDPDSLKKALAPIAKGLMNYDQGQHSGGTVGMMSDPYYWWEAGAAWNSMLDYWFITKDETYNDRVYDALQAQVGKNWDYLPRNQSMTEGNDDQGFWGIAAMAAAERNFSNPPDDKPGWLYLAQAVFNQMVGRWDTDHCSGGLRWQIYTWNSGYDYKNTVSNGCMFNIAARLGHYTRNDTYGEWAEKVYDWLITVKFLNPGQNANGDFRLWDGANLRDDCSQHSNGEWSYNYGLMMSGCAFMYHLTNDTKWEDRVRDIWSRATIFFENEIMWEVACAQSRQNPPTCNNDQRCFRGIFSRFLGHTITYIPALRDDIYKFLNASAGAAAQSCSGGSDGVTCGFNWSYTGWDGVFGLGEQMSALECIQNTYILSVAPPLSNVTGGSSSGSNDAGSKSNTSASLLVDDQKVTAGDKAGAGIVTAVCLLFLASVGIWMLR